MGSFDATCILSDIGISYGDRIACILLQEDCSDEPNRNWNPVSPLLFGKYGGYGMIELDEEPEAFLQHIRPFIVPQAAGSNPYHEPAIDPIGVDWKSLEDWDHHDRLFLYADLEGVRHDASRIAFSEVRDALTGAGIESQSHAPRLGSCYIHAIGHTGFLIADLPWDTKAGDVFVSRIRDVIAPIGYSAHAIPAIGRAYKSDVQPKDHQISLLIAPSIGTLKHIDIRGESKPETLRVKRGFIRAEVLKAFFSVNKQTIKRANLLRNLQREFIGQKDDELNRHRPIMFKYVMQASIGSSERDVDGLWFGSENSNADRLHIVPQILAMPENSPVDAFVPWVRLADIIAAAKHEFRRGLRPTVGNGGSQGAPEDWPDQLKYHQAIVRILTRVIKKFNKDCEDW